MPKQHFADIAQQSRGSGKNLGLKIGGRGGGEGCWAPRPPLDPHLEVGGGGVYFCERAF